MFLILFLFNFMLTDTDGRLDCCCSRVFPGDDEVDAASASASVPPRPRNPWLTGSLLHLLRLTLMALAGYSLSSGRRLLAATELNGCSSGSGSGSSGSSSSSSHTGDNGHKKSSLSGTNTLTNDSKGKHFVTFPLPMEDAAFIGGAGSVTAKLDDVDSNASNNTSLSATISVVCVEFVQIQDVEILWLETVKTLSEFVTSKPVEVSKNSTYCMQGLFLAGHLSNLPAHVWQTMLSDLITKIPLAASDYHKLQLQQSRAAHKANESSQSAVELCLRCCCMVFDVIVLHFRVLKVGEDFHSTWLKFVSVLATNVLDSNIGSPFCNELVDMIGSLLRLLYFIPVASVPSSTASEVSYTRDEILLGLTWKSVSSICPTLRTLLQHKYSTIVSDLTSLESKVSHVLNTRKENDEKTLKATSAASSSSRDYRTQVV